MTAPTPPFRLLVGLSISVSATPRGFSPVERQYGTPVFGDLRLKGWAAAMTNGLAERLVVIGGAERVPTRDAPVEAQVAFHRPGRRLHIPRGYANCYSLVQDHGVDADSVFWRLSEGNTGGNIAALAKLIEEGEDPSGIVVSSNFYHLPRAMADLAAAGLALPALPTESFTIAARLRAGEDRAEAYHDLVADLGGGGLAERSAQEIVGIAEKLNGTYAALAR